jgi:hypothetical protein
MNDDKKTYRIYLKDVSFVECMNKSEFEKYWNSIQNMVGLMKTDYTVNDLRYEEID